MKYEYKTAILENVFQSITQARRQSESQMAGELFADFMKMISDEGWRIISVVSVADTMIYTLERKLK